MDMPVWIDGWMDCNADTGNASEEDMHVTAIPIMVPN